MITDNDHQLISQYLDGELNQAQMAQLEARFAGDSELSAHLEQLLHIDQALRDSVAAEGRVPEHITAMLSQPDDQVVPLRPRRQQRWGLAVAASLLAGIAVVNGPATIEQYNRFASLLAGIAVVNGPRWIAGGPANLTVPDIAESAAFVQILEQQPSTAKGWYTVQDSVQLRPVLSFASSGGTWCREFIAVQAAEAWRGVACRRDDNWDIKLLVQTPGLAGESAGYQTAGAVSADTVDSTDIPLGRTEEAELIATGWQ